MPYRDDPIVTLATFETEFEASLARGALEAIGIRALVPGEQAGTYVRRARGIRGVELKVFERDHARAAVELRRLQIRIVEPDE
ncbi:MAG TPA: hypothetical protein VL173_05665 [Vicinamibacterales bacterium]|nr:hypothetical protein [Vicinamibacterales bacterium]